MMMCVPQCLAYITLCTFVSYIFIYYGEVQQHRVRAPEVRREVREIVGRRISTLFRSECRGDCHVNLKDIPFSTFIFFPPPPRFHYHLPDAKFQNACPLKKKKKKLM